MATALGWKTVLATSAMVCGAVVIAGWCVRYVRREGLAAQLAPTGPRQVERIRFTWKDSRRGKEIKVVLWSSPAENHRPQPLLLLSPAMGRTPADYSVIASDLASYGYLVAGVTPTQSATIDLERREAMQPVVESWVSDLRFALDALQREPDLKERVDPNRIGVFGHSFGGAAAVLALRVDPRFRRAANLDGAPEGALVRGLTRRVLFVLGAPLPPAQKKLNDEMVSEIQAICAANTAGCQIEDRPEARHMNFSDAGLSPSPFALIRARQDLADIDGRAFLYSTAALLRTFYDAM